MYSTGNSTQYSVMTYMGKEFLKEWIYVYVCLIHFAVHPKLTQHGKATLLLFKFFKKLEKKLTEEKQLKVN